MNENAERGKKLMGVKEIADFLGVNESTIWRWLRDPKRGAPIRKVGGRYYALDADLLAWVGLVPA